MIMGIVFSFIAGAAFPLTTVVFGTLIDTFGNWQYQLNNPSLNASNYPGYITPEQLVKDVNSVTPYFLYLAAIVFTCTYLFMAIFVYCSEKQVFKIRQLYLQSVLRQNIGKN